MEKYPVKNEQIKIRVSEEMKGIVAERSPEYAGNPSAFGHILMEKFFEDEKQKGKLIWPPEFRSIADFCISDDLMNKADDVSRRFGMKPEALAAFLLEKFVDAINENGNDVCYPPEFSTKTQHAEAGETCPKVGGPRHLQNDEGNENTKKKAG